jgi:hypothetical protein
MSIQGRAMLEAHPIYHLSRALYRRLAPLVDDEDGLSGSRHRRRVLDSCEYTLRRLVNEPDFARPERFLFEEIRFYFPLSDQVWVRRLIEIHVRLARPLAEELRSAHDRRCSAFSRAGTPCQREARPGSGYCPSHRHLSATGRQQPTPVTVG